MSQQSSPLPTLTPSPEYRSPIPQPNFLPNFPVPYQSPNNPFRSSQRASCEAWSNPNEPNLANTIHNLAQTVRENQGSGNRSKVQEPDVFDGSDTRKLWAFLVQCQLNFNSKPWAFRTDASKVNYAISYLKGTTLDWFEPGLMSDDPLDWISNYSKFTSELKCNFGPHNPKGDVENELKSLWMKNNHGKISCWFQSPCSLSHLGWFHSLTPIEQGTTKSDQGWSFPDWKTIHPLRNAPINSANWCTLLATSIQNILGIQEVQYQVWQTEVQQVCQFCIFFVKKSILWQQICLFIQ